MRDFEQGVNVQYQTVKRIDVKDLLGSGFNPLKNIRQIGAYKILKKPHSLGYLLENVDLFK